MREVKFRAWHPALNRFSEPFGVGGFPHYPTMSGGYVDASGEEIFCQWTGLTDINGVDIYEGDIVKYKADFNTWKKVTIVWQYKEMMNSGWYDAIIFAGPLDVPKNCEVIGNIYSGMREVGMEKYTRQVLIDALKQNEGWLNDDLRRREEQLKHLKNTDEHIDMLRNLISSIKKDLG